MIKTLIGRPRRLFRRPQGPGPSINPEKRNDWLDKVIEASKRQSISFTLLILKGFFGPDEVYPSFGCLLGRMMLSMSFSQGFLPELLYVMHADTEMNIFETIINDCLSFIRVAAQGRFQVDAC